MLIHRMGLVSLLGALAATAGAAPQWNEVTAPAVNTTNCITGAPEALSTSAVGWFGDPMVPPGLNTVYYTRIRWFVTGKPCIGGARVAPEIFLPDGSTLAISTTHPVKCFARNLQTGASTQETQGCPQAAAAGVRGGLGFYPVGQGLATWPTATGFGWEIHVPILSTAPLNGIVNSTDPTVACRDCLTAAVWSIDGITSPFSFPRVGVRTASVTNLPTITYPVPSTTNITQMSATATASLSRAGTVGSVFIEESLTPPSSSTCIQSSNAVPVTAQDPATMTFPLTFSQLTPGTDYYWRMCYVTGGRTHWGVNQVFRTAGAAPPRLFSISPQTALPGREVTLIGADLTGASAVRINGTMGPVPATITSVTSSAVKFLVPDETVVGTVSVTTPGGTTTSPFGFWTGIDTILDSVEVYAEGGGATLNDVSVRFHSTEPFPNPAFECRLDDDLFARSCDAGVVYYYDLPPGNHRVRVAARAEGWSDFSPLVVPFTIAGADTTPPDTTLLMGPMGDVIRTATATFTFSSTEAGSTFECSNNPPWEWIPCTSPYTTPVQEDGFHLFAVRARDVVGHVDPTPARTSYTVDTVPPETILYSLAPAAGVTTTTSTSAHFLGLMLLGGRRLQCSLDAEPFSNCSAPIQLTNLSRTTHTFRVRAVDLAGNVDPTPATRTWTITP